VIGCLAIEPGRLEQIVRLVGNEALPDRQRWVLEAARLLKEGFLRQNALHPVDATCPPKKQAALLRLFVRLFEQGRDLIDGGVPLVRVRGAIDIGRLVRLKETVPADDLAGIEAAESETDRALAALREAPAARSGAGRTLPADGDVAEGDAP